MKKQLHEMSALRHALAIMPEGAALRQYAEYLNELLTEKDPLFADEYEPIIRNEAEVSVRPFLSVIMRTQGKRPEMLQEALLSLLGQSDMDFEVVLVGHKLDDAQRGSVQHIVDCQSPALRQRIRFVELDEGNRTKPLNYGFALARGEYIAVLDDDDIVMDHWVSSFRAAAAAHPGAMLHAYVLAQDWMRVTTADGGEALRAVSAPDSCFCETFDMLRQMRQNRCPLHGLAFPAFVFRKWGIIFDESLTTYEDWDYLMRVAALVGVVDIETPTAVYRKWVNTENAYSVHHRSEWQSNYSRVREKLLNMPVLLGQGSAGALVGAAMERGSEECKQFDSTKLEKSKLYLDFGEGFREHDTVHAPVHRSGDAFDVMFRVPETECRPVCSVRFDLTEDGMFAMSDVVCVLQYADGTQTVRHLQDGQSSGIALGESVLFPGQDPWTLWAAEGKALVYAHITGQAGAVLPAEAMAVMSQRLQQAQQPGVVGRVLRKGKAVVKKIIGK